ncbi:MAG: CDP-alcohol phosphatidyltransferase family protein [Halomonadaceae bacterium]|nr:MAG: CDP-alcohol phosphatidyltransferase family protein [Halomonadaceae bacterium]
MPGSPMPVSPEVPCQLQRELLRIALLGAGLLAVAAVVLSVITGPGIALIWWLPGVACWGFVLWQCHRRLHLNRSPVDDRGFATLGHGNRTTLLRGLLIAGMAGFVFISPGAISPGLLYLPATLYTAAALGDLLDGYLARRQQQITRLGTELDTVLDAFGLVVAPLVAVMYDKLHVSYLLVSIAYYLFQWGLRWRQYHGLPVYPLPPSRLRRFLAGLQMTLVAIVLWPPLPGGITSTLGVALMIPLLIGFCRDWLHVSGRLGVQRGRAS